MFFGVPHRGLRHPALLRPVQGQGNEDLVRSLVVTKETEPTPYLRRIGHDFARAFNDASSSGERRLAITSFYETKPTPSIKVCASLLSGHHA